MDNSWKQVIAALLMGVLLPRIAIGAGKTLPAPEVTAPPATGIQTEPKHTFPTASETTAQDKQFFLPVLVRQDAVEMMELETYVKRVVMAEMSAGFEPEALKAQAVVARTYAVRRFLKQDRHPQGAVCGDPGCCQAYITEAQYLKERGTQKDLQEISAAVQATRGQVLTYGGELIESTYFSCSGGRTEDAAAVWGADIPYLQSVESPGEEKAKPYWNQVRFTAEEFQKALGRQLSGPASQWLGEITYTPGGGVRSILIGGMCYKGTQIRRLLRLNSTVFSIHPEGDIITVETLGKGHRVGMSQYGADAMAVDGKTWQQILAYYYQGTRIDKLSAIG